MDTYDNDIFTIDPETAWLETIVVGGFRVWHVIACCLGVLLMIIIMVCCCVRFRIPRTKQEIEADYQRKQITKKFREKLQQIKISDIDDMSLQKVISRIQSEMSSHSGENINECDTNIKLKNNVQSPA